MNKNLTAKKIDGFSKAFFKFSISVWVNFIINVLAGIITIRIFSPSIYGSLSVFNTTSVTVMNLVILGLDSSYIRFYNEPPKGEDYKQLGLKLFIIPVFLIVFIGIIITTFFYRPFTESIFNRCSWIISFMLFINALSMIGFRFLNISYRMNFNVKQYNIQSILLQLASRLFVVAAALFNPNIEFVIVFNVVGVFSLFIIYFFIQSKNLLPKEVNFDISKYKSVFKYALSSAPLPLCISLNIFISQQIIIHFMGISAVGVYSVASWFAAILIFLQGGFANYWSAFMFANYKKEQKKIIQVHNYMMIFLLVIFIAIIIFQDLIFFFIGYKYYEIKSFFALLLVYPILILAGETTAYGISIEKKSHITLCNYIISIIVNLAISLLLIKPLGLIGVAMASCISAIILFTLNTYWGQKYYKSISNVKRTFFSGILIIAIAVIASIIKNNVVLCFMMLAILVIVILVYLAEVKTLGSNFLGLIKKKSNKDDV